MENCAYLNLDNLKHLTSVINIVHKASLNAKLHYNLIFLFVCINTVINAVIQCEYLELHKSCALFLVLCMLDTKFVKINHSE